MARVKFGKLLLLIFTLIVSASLELRASTDSPLPAVTSFAYPTSHAVTPLPNAVFEKLAERDSDALEIDYSESFVPNVEKPVVVPTNRERLLTQSRLCSAVAAVARANNLPIPFFANLIWQESNFDSGTISRAGAQGIAQFMPETANEFGLINPFEPIHALNVAGKLLRGLYDQFGNFGLAAAAYNAGPRRVMGWMARRSGLPGETLRYVLKVTGRSLDQWARLPVKTDPAAALMPAKAPCIEVAKAVEAQAKVVRVSRLISELAEATLPPAHERQDAGKPDAPVAKLAAAKPDRKPPAVRMAMASAKRSADNAASETLAKSAAKSAAKSVAKSLAKTSGKSVEKSSDNLANKPTAKSSHKSESKSAAKAAAKSETRSAAKSSGKSETKTAVKAPHKSNSKIGAKATGKSLTKTAATEVSSKSETKAAAKTSQKNESKTAAKPEDKSVTKTAAKASDKSNAVTQIVQRRRRVTRRTRVAHSDINQFSW